MYQDFVNFDLQTAKIGPSYLPAFHQCSTLLLASLRWLWSLNANQALPDSRG